MSVDAAYIEVLETTRAQIGVEIWANFGLIIIISLAISCVIGMVGYFFYSIGLYTVVKRRNHNGAWLAWLPIGRTWMLGEVSNRYQFARKKKIQGWDSFLVKLELSYLAMQAGCVLLLEGFVSNMLSALVWTEIRKTIEAQKPSRWERPAWEEALELVTRRELTAQEQIIMPLLLLGALLLIMVVIQIFFYRAHYDLFASCRPDLKVVFLVLSIVFPVTLPFFVFACRKHDQGLAEQPKQENSAAGIWVEAASTTDKD